MSEAAEFTVGRSALRLGIRTSLGRSRDTVWQGSGQRGGYGRLPATVVAHACPPQLARHRGLVPSKGRWVHNDVSTPPTQRSLLAMSAARGA